MLIQSGVNPILCITGYNISIHKELLSIFFHVILFYAYAPRKSGQMIWKRGLR